MFTQVLQRQPVLSLNAAAYFYVLLRTELRFAQFIRLCRSSVSVCPEYRMPDP